MHRGICTNDFDPCERFVSRDPVSVPEGADFECPDCGAELLPISDRPGLFKRLRKSPLSRIAALVVVGGSLLGVGLAGAHAVGLIGPSDAGSPSPDSSLAAVPPDSIAARPDSSDATPLNSGGEGESPDDVPVNTTTPTPPPEGPSTTPTGSTQPPSSPPTVVVSPAAPPPQIIERVIERPVIVETPSPAPARDCTGYTRRISRLSLEECPALTAVDRREACYAEVERLRSEFAICQGG